MSSRLKMERVRRDLTQFKLCISVNIPQSRYSLIENELLTPRNDEILRISRALGVRPEELFPVQAARESR